MHYVYTMQVQTNGNLALKPHSHCADSTDGCRQSNMFYFCSHHWKKSLFFFSIMSGWGQWLVGIYRILQRISSGYPMCLAGWADGWSGKPDDCSRSMKEMPSSIRELPRSMSDMPRSMQNPSRWSRMLEGWLMVVP